VRVLAAKTEFKTIASKIIQHPAVTIERIKLRRRVIELSVQTRLGGAAASNHAAATPNRAVRMAGWGAASAKPRDCVGR
jgi:hypothetical protein